MTEQSPAEAIFFAALEKRTDQERAAYLDAACGEDRNLRERVERLLAAHPQIGSFLESHPQAKERPAETSAYSGPSEGVGATIAGKYKLLESLGEGGMGTVFMAQQTAPVKRLVALKLIKLGMDSRQVLARFEAERRALALMDHPNIAKVLDAGTTESGRPFFVMELVKGVPITRFCDERQLSLRERLELFIPVCHAIQHAHQKGVIHRDIKPTNVLVALYDDRPVPKVIDFGVAKAAGSQLTDLSLVTGFGAIVGTLEYMSPEQAQLNQLDIDTRSDVYALGVLLYELLTGTTPIDRKRLGRDALLEVLRVIREEEPPPPSTRLSTSQALASIAATRKTEPAKLARLMRGELDWIVMKCLEKERSRRYETANGLSRDLEHYLHDEVVEARPPSASYRLRKFVRKHRMGLAAAASFAALLIAAVVVSGWLALRRMRAEAIAQEMWQQAEASANDARANANAWLKVSEQHLEAVIDAEIRGLGLKVDLDLAELRTDPRIGLLRLAHPLKATFKARNYGPNFQGEMTATIHSDHPPLLELRQFVTAAVLATGQNYAPLLRPITHDGLPIRSSFLSAKRGRLLTRGADKTARLWDTFTGRQIAILRQVDETVLEAGLSPDGATAFTHGSDGVIRLWETKDGAFRVATEPRPERIKLKIHGSFDPFAEEASWFSPTNLVVTHLSDDRLLTECTELEIWQTKKKTGNSKTDTGPVELWNTTTGRLVARLDTPGHLDKFHFIGKRWITTVRGNTAQVFSAEDGRLRTRLAHPTEETVAMVDASPTGRRLITLSGKMKLSVIDIPTRWDSLSVREWDVETGQVQAVTSLPSNALPFAYEDFFGTRILRVPVNALPFAFRYWMEDAPGGGGSVVAWGWDAGWFIYRLGHNEPIAKFPGAAIEPDSLARAGNLVHGGNGWVSDVRTWQRFLPPPGRKFHPDLARFAPDGRFVAAAINSNPVLIDTQTDKALQTQYDWHSVPAQGIIAVQHADHLATIRLLPPVSKLDLPPDLLELWAQVAVRGELDGEGRFIKWDEATWEKKRQELAAKPAPYPDFPFPGHVAADRLHWLRQEYLAAREADKPRLAKQLLARAEAAGDRAEAVRWRALVAPKPAAPKPKEP